MPKTSNGQLKNFKRTEKSSVNPIAALYHKYDINYNTIQKQKKLKVHPLNFEKVFKLVHRRQKLTTDFFQLFLIDYFGCDTSISRKKYTMFSGGSYFKGLDNKIIGSVRI